MYAFAHPVHRVRPHHLVLVDEQDIVGVVAAALPMRSGCPATSAFTEQVTRAEQRHAASAGLQQTDSVTQPV
jgi:hypothetical protein